jgi:hypothetical protein
MARLTKTEAARQLGISRTILYKLIDQGRVSATPDGMIDETELVHAAPYVDMLKERSRTSMDTADVDMNLSYDEHRERPPEPVHGQPWTPVHERPWTSTDPLVDVLREQLQRAQERERVYEERERDYREHIARLTAMLHETQQQNQRLLDMPRSAPASPLLGPRASGIDEAPRGEMRRRIVALLQEHPDGLTPGEMRTLLGVDRSLADTCLGMLRYGLVQRVERGRYVAAAPSYHD